MGLRPLLAAIKCNNMAMARLLIDHGAHVHQQNCKRSELHALAETQKGPYPAVRAPHLTKSEAPPHTHTRTTARTRLLAPQWHTVAGDGWCAVGQHGAKVGHAFARGQVLAAAPGHRRQSELV